MEKNKFLVFIFSFLPGAGYMYLNMMKKGVILMLVFLGLGAVSASMGMSFLICILPVLWFYTFFDTFHMARMEYETRLYEDKVFYENVLKLFDGNVVAFLDKRRKFAGFIAIFFSIYAMIYGVLLPFFSWNDWHYMFWPVVRLLRVIPTIIVVVFLFLCGKKLLKEEDDGDFRTYQQHTDTEKTEKSFAEGVSESEEKMDFTECNMPEEEVDDVTKYEPETEEKKTQEHCVDLTKKEEDKWYGF